MLNEEQRDQISATKPKPEPAALIAEARSEWKYHFFIQQLADELERLSAQREAAP